MDDYDEETGEGMTRLERRLHAENVLLNELVSDQRKEIKELQQQVNRLSRAMLNYGYSVYEVRNIVQGP